MRNFECPNTGEHCIDPRCKRDICYMDLAKAETAEALVAARAETEIRMVVTAIVNAACRSEGRPIPDREFIDRVMKDDAMRKMAESVLGLDVPAVLSILKKY